jgi:carbonic anhydrase
MPSNKDYYKFMGSLTTPPCSENVKWNVYKTEMTISKKQVKEFYNIFGHTNNRAFLSGNLCQIFSKIGLALPFLNITATTANFPSFVA